MSFRRACVRASVRACGRCRTTRQPVHAAQRVRETPVTCHAAHQVRCGAERHARRRDVQRPGRSPAQHFGGVRRGPEPGLGDPEHGQCEPGVRHMGAQARPSGGVEVHVPVDDQQVKGRGVGQHLPQCGQLALVEPSWPVLRHPLDEHGPFLGQGGECRVVGDDECCPRPAVVQVLHVDRAEADAAFRCFRCFLCFRCFRCCQHACPRSGCALFTGHSHSLT